MILLLKLFAGSVMFFKRFRFDTMRERGFDQAFYITPTFIFRHRFHEWHIALWWFRRAVRVTYIKKNYFYG